MPRRVSILSHDDPRLEPYRSIRERDLVGRDGRFIIEGEVVLRLAVARGRHPIESVLVTEAKADRLGDLAPSLPEECDMLTAPGHVIDAIAGFAVHRGILAIGQRREPASTEALLDSLPASALVVVLAGLANHDNVGGIFRNAAAFAADAVLLDRECCDPLYRKATRVSVGSTLTMPFTRGGDVETLCAALVRHGFSIALTTPAGRADIATLPRTRRRALVFGTEGRGLDPRLLGRFETLRIDMPGAIDSLNVATASGIALFHAARARQP